MKLKRFIYSKLKNNRYSEYEHYTASNTVNKIKLDSQSENFVNKVVYHKFQAKINFKDVLYAGTLFGANIKESFIVMPYAFKFKTQRDYYRILFHELIHLSGIYGKLKRSFIYAKENTPEYYLEEVIAEMGSLMFLKEFGFNVSKIKDSAHYVNDFINYFLDKESDKTYEEVYKACYDEAEEVFLELTKN